MGKGNPHAVGRQKLIKTIGDPDYVTPVTGQSLPNRMPTPTSLNDPEDPTSLESFVPPKVAAAIRRFSNDLLRMTEADLRRELKPDDMLCRLRLAFWDEYQRAHNLGEKMVTKHIVSGVCSEDYFYKWILTDQLKMRWVCQVPKDYYLSMREMLDRGLDRLRDILELDFMEIKYVKVGKDQYQRQSVVNTKILSEIRAAVQMLDNRVKGAVMQKVAIQQQSLNYNINHEANDEDLGALTLEQLSMLEEKLSAVDKRLTAAGAELLPEGMSENDQEERAINVGTATSYSSSGD